MVCILALADAASLIFDEHLLGAVDGQGSNWQYPARTAGDSASTTPIAEPQ